MTATSLPARVSHFSGAVTSQRAGREASSVALLSIGVCGIASSHGSRGRYSAGDALPLPLSVTGVLKALVPQDALHDAFTRTRGRGGNTLFEGHRLVDEAEAARLLGAEAPTLSALRRPGVVERIGARSFAPGPGQVDGGSALGSLRVAYLPAGLQWQNVQMWSLLCEGGVVLEVMLQDADPRRQKVWPRRLSRSGEAEGGDYAVVVVESCEVGVQVDVSGITHLTWMGRRNGKVLRLVLLIESPPQAALELVASGGLLT